jgi:hypothetical protein
VRILITHAAFAGYYGTETYMLTVAEALERLGHAVTVHASRLGPMADFARARGVRVLEAGTELPGSCDAVLAQDAATAYEMAARYPDAVRVFVAHSIGFPLQTPPQVEGACHAVVALNERVHARMEQLGWRPEVVRLRQPIDLERFCFRSLYLPQRRPPRVLVLQNDLQGTRARVIEEACRAAGVSLARLGFGGRQSSSPELAIDEAEIVISTGRGVLEAMASGRAAYVFGVAGGDGWVTGESYAALEADGFAGGGSGRAVDAGGLAADLSGWDEHLGEVGRDLAVSHHSASRHAVELVELIQRLGGAPPMPAAPVDELARLVRAEWNASARTRDVMGEVSALQSRVAGLEAELERANEHAGELDRELRACHERLARLDAAHRALRSTRRYRIGAWLARPLDRLRGRRQRA